MKKQAFEIPIGDFRYHTNTLTQSERQWGRDVYRRVEEKEPELRTFVHKELSSLQLSDEGERELLGEITLAFCHAIKVSFSPENEEQLQKAVKKWMLSFLPYIVKNRSASPSSHPVQYEPITATAIYLSCTIQGILLSRIGDKKDAPIAFETCYLIEATALMRAIRSSLLLLSLGDDVHGVSLLRGVLEIACKLSLAPEFPEEYVLFKQYNVHLQANKHNGTPLPSDMTERLKSDEGYRRNLENYLAYGWAKNKNGKRILTMREFLKTGTRIKKIDRLIQISSEFVHEDYSFVGYDYVSIRRTLIDYYFFLLHTFINEDLFSLPCKDSDTLRALLHTASDVYAGEISLRDKFK